MNLILDNLNSIYVEFKKFIHENLSSIKKIYYENNNIFYLSFVIDVKNNIIEDFNF